MSFHLANAQESSVAIVRQVNYMQHSERQGALTLNMPGKEMQVFELKSALLDENLIKTSVEDDQIVMKVFIGLLNDGFELESTSTTWITPQDGGISKTAAGREIVYIFTKEGKE
jgi:hypothetical protein